MRGPRDGHCFDCRLSRDDRGLAAARLVTCSGSSGIVGGGVRLSASHGVVTAASATHRREDLAIGVTFAERYGGHAAAGRRRCFDLGSSAVLFDQLVLSAVQLSSDGAPRVTSRISLPHTESLVAYSSVAVLLGALVFASGTSRGWLGMLGYVGIGAVFLLGRTGMPRYARASGAVMFVAMAASFGFPIVWMERAAWVDDVRRVIMVVAMLGYARYVWSLRAVPSAAQP